MTLTFLSSIPRARLAQISDPRMAPDLPLKADQTCLASR